MNQNSLDRKLESRLMNSLDCLKYVEAPAAWNNPVLTKDTSVNKIKFMKRLEYIDKKLIPQIILPNCKSYK